MAIYESVGRSDEEGYEPLPLEEKPREEEKAKQWYFPLGGSVVSSATVTDNIVYVGSCDKHMYALSTKDGKLLWKFRTGEPLTSSPTVVGDAVYFCGNDGYFYALSKRGELIWRFRKGSEGESISSPAIVDKKIFFGSNNGCVYCLNLDGREEWRFQTGSRVISSPSIANDTVFIPSYDSNFYALSTDGRLRWKYTMGNSSGCSATIIDNNYNEIWRFRKFNDHDPGRISISNGLAIVGSWDNHVYALDIDDGRKIWSHITGGLVGSSPTVLDKRVYFGSFDAHLHCLDVEDGRLLWKLRTGGQVDSSPVINNGMIYFGSYDQNIYAFSLVGEKSWSFLTGGMIEATPEIKSSVLYIGSFDTYFYAIDLATRKVLWQFKMGLPPPPQSQIRPQIDLVTQVTSHRFTRWRPEIIKPKNVYETKTETTRPVFSDQPYQALHPYESRVEGSYGGEKKKKKQPEFGFF